MSVLQLVLAFVTTAETVERAEHLGPYAMAFMLISMGAVTILMLWCFSKILAGKDHFDPDGTGPAKPPVPGKADRRPGPGDG